jgi:hypothetical protein
MLHQEKAAAELSRTKQRIQRAKANLDKIQSRINERTAHLQFLTGPPPEPPPNLCLPSHSVLTKLTPLTVSPAVTYGDLVSMDIACSSHSSWYWVAEQVARTIDPHASINLPQMPQREIDAIIREAAAPYFHGAFTKEQRKDRRLIMATKYWVYDRVQRVLELRVERPRVPRDLSEVLERKKWIFEQQMEHPNLELKLDAVRESRNVTLMTFSMASLITYYVNDFYVDFY